jgi:hypothetical protein
MALPSNLGTITVYDDYIDNPGGRPVVGTGSYRSTQLRRELVSGLTLVPVAKTFQITEQDQTINGQTIRTGHWEVVCPLGVDPDYSGPDAYTFTIELTGVDTLLAKPGPVTVILTADMGPRVRLSSLAPAVPVAQLGSGLTVEVADSRYATQQQMQSVFTALAELEQAIDTAPFGGTAA